jgi:hypothetical protein
MIDVRQEWVDRARETIESECMDVGILECYPFDLNWPPNPDDPCHPVPPTNTDLSSELPVSVTMSHARPDLIFGSDITYSEDLIESLVLHLRHLLVTPIRLSVDENGDLDIPRKKSGHNAIPDSGPLCILAFDHRPNCDMDGQVRDVLHDRLLELLSEPFWLGGGVLLNSSARYWFRFGHRYLDPAQIPNHVQYSRPGSLRLLVIWTEPITDRQQDCAT